jgi:protocatechuate 3,4-dioxygenase beta subunit
MQEGEYKVIRSAIVATLFLTCFASAVLPADKKDKEEDKLRMVQGEVTDPQDNPLTGAVVQLKNSKTLQVRSFITQANGTYQFHGLDPNVDYTLKADYQGASSPWKTLSSFDSRKQPTMNLKIPVKK